MIPYQKQAKVIGKLSPELQEEIHTYMSGLLFHKANTTLDDAAKQVCELYQFDLPTNTVISWFYRRNNDRSICDEKVFYNTKHQAWSVRRGWHEIIRDAAIKGEPSKLAMKELGLYKHPDIASNDVIQIQSPRIDEALNGETIDVTKGGNNLAFLDIKAGDVEIRIQFNVS
jgi:hypothetical protein